MTESKKKFDIISLLPPEMQVNIFHMLTTKEKSRCALVCKEWNNIVNMNPVWRGFTFELTTKTNLKNCRIQCESLASRGIRRVRMISRNENDVGLMFLNDVALCITNLVQLEILCSRATNEMLELISRNFTKLVHLDILFCNDVTDVGIGHLTGQGSDVTYAYPRLDYLVLGMCRKLTDTSLQYLSNGQPQLKCLRLFSAVLLTDSGLIFLSTMASLKKLELSGENEKLSDQGLGHLANLTQLQYFNFFSNTKFTGQGIRHLQKMVKLRHLVIHSLYYNKLDIKNILRAIPKVHTLSLKTTTIDDLGLEILCRSNLRITKLKISCYWNGNENFTDEGLKAIALLSELQELSLIVCCNIFGSGLAHIAEGNTKLTSLSLSGCQRISSTLAIEHIAKMKQLRTLIWFIDVNANKDELLFLTERLPLLKVTC